VPDYGHPLRFGTLIEPAIDDPMAVLDLAAVTERAGLDLVSVGDRPLWPERLDTFTLLAAVAAHTTTVGLLSNLANLPLRPPAMLAQIATTINAISSGRFELGIGGGVQQLWDLIVAQGGPARIASESIDALGEAVQIIRALYRNRQPVTFPRAHHHRDNITADPPPAHAITIWLGAYQPRMLQAVGRLADTWLTKWMRQPTLGTCAKPGPPRL
jgi:alkanesulfonate monooxygenase SsuD/methylene tetrahydromethanopterin reductase-like flavin-dependent oxidoreductase (luciferase family)